MKFRKKAWISKSVDFTQGKITLTQELADIRQQRQIVQQEIGQLDEALSLANLQQKEKLSEKTNVEI